MAARKDGKQGYKSEKPWRDALQRAAKRHAYGTGGPRQLERIADKVIDMAGEGDMAAAKEIGDRLDGKPVQGLALEVGAKIITVIERRIVDMPEVIDGECEVVPLDRAKSNGVEPVVIAGRPLPRKLSDRR